MRTGPCPAIRLRVPIYSRIWVRRFLGIAGIARSPGPVIARMIMRPVTHCATRIKKMNKAFIREPDEISSRCPKCQSIGQPVGPQTLNAQLGSDLRRKLAESANFCPDGQCDIVYFDDFSGVVTREEFNKPIPVKDAEAPLCSCFGLKRDDIDDDISEGVVTRTKAAILKAQSSEARCASLAPNGRSCISDVQGYFLKCKQRHSN